jgi:RHS repeat-associated protein
VGGSFARTGLPLAITATAYNANNQLTTWGTANLFYDANGNMTSDGTHSYTWDARNQLKQIDSGTTASFTYDPFGRRTSKNVLSTSTSFLYDHANAVQEVIGGTVTVNSLAGRVDEMFQRTESAGTRNFLRDALGSTVALADSTGTLQTQYTFEPFGNTTLSGSSTTNSFAYTGREGDLGNLYYYRARYYNPQLQRFISEDPKGLAGGINLYAYTRNNPTNLRDPSGLWGTGQVGIGGGGSFLGPIGGVFGGGLAVDGQGNVGLYGYYGLGLGTGAGGNLGLQLLGSNGCTIDDLKGKFAGTSLGAGDGAAGAADGFAGSSPHGPVTGGGVTLGAGIGGSSFGGGTYTWVIPLFNLKNPWGKPCSPSSNNGPGPDQIPIGDGLYVTPETPFDYPQYY